jgi:hypothetical protein
MDQDKPCDLETDPRFPSGPWVGYFLQRQLPGRHMMELRLTFRHGDMRGEGRDRVGRFTIRGHYDLDTGKCYWTKRYIGQHDVFYQGYNEGKGIWGVWEIPHPVFRISLRGGFHIWPEGMADPTGSHLAAEAEPPLPVEEPEEAKELVGAQSGLSSTP